MTYPDTPFQRLLADIDASYEFRKWVGYRSLEQVWAECPDGSWLLELEDAPIFRFDLEALAEPMRRYYAAYNDAMGIYTDAEIAACNNYRQAVFDAEAKVAARDGALGPAQAAFRATRDAAWEAREKTIADGKAGAKRALVDAKRVLADAIREVHPEPPPQGDTMTYPNTDLQRRLARLNACGPAREWVGGRTLAEAWIACQRGDWMLWLDRHGVVQLDREATAEAEAAYRKARAPALAARREAIDQARAAYDAAIDRAEAAYDAAIDRAEAAYEAAIVPALADYRKATAPARAAYSKAVDPAAAALAGAIREAHPEPPVLERT